MEKTHVNFKETIQNVSQFSVKTPFSGSEQTDNTVTNDDRTEISSTYILVGEDVFFFFFFGRSGEGGGVGGQ